MIQAARLKPDVITLDVEMPEVSGLEALPLLLAAHEAPVIMVSALTQEGADVTLQALELGAVDFMPKPERNQLAEMRASSDLLVAKVLTAAQSRVRRVRRGGTLLGSSLADAASGNRDPAVDRHRPRPARRASGTARRAIRGSPSASPSAPACLVIGISTGGPQALSQVFPLLTPPTPPILVVQHMPAQFTGVFAERLNRSCSLTVKEAAEGDPVLPDQVLIAPGGRHMALAGHSPARAGQPFRRRSRSAATSHRSTSCSSRRRRIYQSAAVGMIMTGMGRDGVDGCKAILAAGGLHPRPGRGDLGRLRHEQGRLPRRCRQGPVRPR